MFIHLVKYWNYFLLKAVAKSVETGFEEGHRHGYPQLFLRNFSVKLRLFEPLHWCQSRLDPEWENNSYFIYVDNIIYICARH